MSLDQRLRAASREIHDSVAGRIGAPLTSVARRRNRIVTATAIAAACAVTIGVAAWTLDGSPALNSDVAVSAPTPTTAAAEPTTSAPSTTSIPPEPTTAAAPVEDGLSQLELIPDEWQEALVDGGVVLLAEDDVVLVARDLPNDVEGVAPPVAHIEGMAARVDLGISEVTSGLPPVWASFGLTADSDRVRVFGVAPPGAESVEFRWDPNQRIVIEGVYQRVEVGRSVFLGSVGLDVLMEHPPAPMNLMVTTNGGTTEESELELQSWLTASDYDGPFADLFAVEQPLVAGSAEIGELEVVTCQAPDGVAAPPNRSGTGSNLGTHATPEEALQALVQDSGADPVLPTSGYLEIPQPDGTIAYAVPFEGGDGFVTAVWTASTGDDEWTVDHWEASGC